MHNWEQQTTNDLRYITVPSWMQRGVDVAISTRTGGVSEAPFQSLNLGLHVGDQAEAVLENRHRYMGIFGQELQSMVCCEQIHGNQVIRVDESYKGRGALSYADSIPGYDGMITNQPGVYLATYYADCLPVCFFDPIKRAIGMAHSGWKGTMGRIVVNTIEAMQREFGSSRYDIEVFMGPAIGRCCFEIQPDLANKVKIEFNRLNNIIFKGENDDIYTWDLQNTNRQLLIESGINPLHIIICDICTASNTDSFFSYRREQGQTGRMGALLGLRI
ncbi:MAG: peptidoglycan editing factor PgeF [Syntrophomonas sp.]